MTLNCQLALYYCLRLAGFGLEAPPAEYSGVAEETEAAELAQFVSQASAQNLTPPPPRAIIRINRGMRIYIGQQELKLRPMSKAILLLFLMHPEGIALKDIGNYKDELTRWYSRVAKADDPAKVAHSISRVLDVFSNELNVNLSRVNAALSALKNDGRYHFEGGAGEPKSLKMERTLVIWE